MFGHHMLSATINQLKYRERLIEDVVRGMSRGEDLTSENQGAIDIKRLAHLCATIKEYLLTSYQLLSHMEEHIVYASNLMQKKNQRIAFYQSYKNLQKKVSAAIGQAKELEGSVALVKNTPTAGIAIGIVQRIKYLREELEEVLEILNAEDKNVRWFLLYISHLEDMLQRVQKTFKKFSVAVEDMKCFVDPKDIKPPKGHYISEKFFS